MKKKKIKQPKELPPKDEWEEFMKNEFKGTHPQELVKKTFPEKVMDIICSDHHKSKDGGFTISYDNWTEEWTIAHYGYVREVEESGKSFVDTAQTYLHKIGKENTNVQYGELIDKANNKLPKGVSIEPDGFSLSVYVYEEGKGEDLLKCTMGFDMKGKKVDDIVKAVEKILKEDSELK